MVYYFHLSVLELLPEGLQVVGLRELNRNKNRKKQIDEQNFLSIGMSSVVPVSVVNNINQAGLF
jgi:hypothetical protein